MKQLDGAELTRADDAALRYPVGAPVKPLAQEGQDAVRAERDMYATMAAVVPGAFASYRLRPNGTFEMPYATASIVDLFGATAEELLEDALIARERTHPDDRDRVADALAVSARDMTPFRCEYRVQHPSRGELWVEVNSGPTRESDGSILWHGFVLDVTARKRLEHELREQRDRLEGLAASSPGAIYTFRRAADGTLSFPYLSHAMEHIYGVSLDAIARDPQAALGLVHPGDVEHVTASTTASAQTMTPWRCEYRVENPKRGEIWVEGHSRPTRDADGGISWHGVLLDVSDRRRDEARLRASESTLRAVVETVPDFLILVGRDRTIRYINHLLPGYAMADVIGSDAMQYIAPAMREATAKTMDEVFATGQLHVDETAALSADGEVRWYNTRTGPVVDGGEVIAVTLASTDITDSKQAQEKLRASEERYRTLVDLLPDAVFLNSGGKISFCNAAFVRLMGADSAEQLIGLTPFDVFHESDHPAIHQRIAHMKAQGEPVPAAEETVVALDGTARRVSVVATLIGAGEHASILVVLHDLTARQRTEHLLESVLESVNDAIITIDARGTVLLVNPATSRLFGYSADDLAGNNIKLLMTAADANAHDGHLAAYDPSHDTRSVGRGREVTGRRKDGTTFPVELSVTSFQLNGTQHFTGVVRDITERKKLEDQFRQAHKMEAFGQLAGGVAHDFNNLLTVILGETELLVATLPENDPSVPSLAEIHEAGQRAAALTRQLLAFSRRTVLEPKILDINLVVRETEKMLRRLIGEDIRLSTKLAPSLMPVNVDPNQLGQVLMNMAVNARDAMPKGGDLAIETANVLLDEQQASARPGLSPGAFVRLVIRDTGTGMSADVRARVFQPFFTTKGVGKGTGLGLAVAHGIVAQSGGAIDVTSEEGCGTTFEILLPVAVLAPLATPAERAQRSLPAYATLLLVEDDDAVRRLAMRALGTTGYNVLLAHDGAEALAIIERSSQPVDILITDVVMPNMDGRELGDALRRRFPRMKVLYVSGYTEDVLVRRGIQSEEVEFLAKPYTPSSLVVAVRRALAQT